MRINVAALFSFILLVQMLVIRSPSQWVAIFDQDQAGLELAATRKTTTKGAPQLLQIERNIPTDRILQRIPIEQADLPEALTLEPCIRVQNHINPNSYIRPILTSGCREAPVQDFGNQST